MNILFLSNHLNVGGISSYLLSLGKGLVCRGHKVYLASSGGELAPKFKEAGMEFIPVPVKIKNELHPNVMISCLKLNKVIKENKIDIMHANTRVTQVISGTLSKFSGIPYVTTCHGYFKKSPGRRFLPLWGHRVIAISEPVKQHLLLDFGVPQEKVKLIYNGIEIDRFKNRQSTDKGREKTRLGLTQGPVAGIIARLSDVKGHCYLLEAMKKVLEQLPGAQLLIVGDGREKDKLLKLADEFKLGKSVKFIYAVDDTAKILPVMDVFVMPSLQEGLGLAVMEAQAAGLAVVASNIGGLNVLVRDGESGRLVLPKDVDGLAAAIVELLKDKDKAEKFGRSARSFIENNFSQDLMVCQTEDLYKECLTP
ncbi:MAG: glycosyltransferase family 4 protein, partial [Candidatus Omnitrophica bacterium]|nr:glycosyltransferase family 4 protein [Candidatus Omnitrophota bacterium]MDD5654433.1 glycosyltransferase family 4 protein [Candidatus Omnitrophota bacterium]